MGVRLVKFKFTPEENEQIEAVIKVPEERRSVIHGVVLGCDNKPVKDAVVKLFVSENHKKCCNLTPITHTFTDECGQFLFGPLCPDKCYTIKVWYNSVKIRQLVIPPEDCESHCLTGDDKSPMNIAFDCEDSEENNC